MKYQFCYLFWDIGKFGQPDFVKALKRRYDRQLLLRLYIKWHFGMNITDTAEQVMHRLTEIGDELQESQPTARFIYLLAASLGEFINDVLDEVEVTMGKFYQARHQLRAENGQEGFRGALMDMLVEARLYTNFDWQAWVAAMETVREDSD